MLTPEQKQRILNDPDFQALLPQRQSFTERARMLQQPETTPIETPTIEAQPEVKTGFWNRVKETGADFWDMLKGAGEAMQTREKNIEDIVKSEDTVLEKLNQSAGQVGGTISDVAGEIYSGVAKIFSPQELENKAKEVVENAMQKIQESDPRHKIGIIEGLKADLELLGMGAEKVKELAEKHPRIARNLEAVGNIGMAVADVYAGGAGGKLAKEAGEKAIEAGVKGAKIASKGAKTAGEALTKTNKALMGITKTGGKGIKTAVKNGLEPEHIMQRVARISKGKQAKFEKMAGDSVGKFLVDRKIFGNIPEIAGQLAKRFEKSKSSVDRALAKLKGKYKNSAVYSALKELEKRENEISATGALSKDLERVRGLAKKHKGGGLTMEEINEAKRLYERNVKQDFVRENIPKSVAQANNIDNAIRKFQFEKAKELGFKNLPDLNKETRLTKQLLDYIGDEYRGSAGNNAVTLTDWIILGGSPDPATAISSFLTKKALSSKKVQSAVAKGLSKNLKEVPTPKAEIGKPTINGFRDFARKTKQQPQPIKSIKSRKSYNNNTLKLSTSKAVEAKLLMEAKKYKSANEFAEKYPKKIKDIKTGEKIIVNGYHGTPDGRFLEEFDKTKKGYFSDAPELLPDNTEFEKLYGEVGGGFKTERGVYKGISFTDNYNVAKSYSEKPTFDYQNSVPMIVERNIVLENPKVIDVLGKNQWDIKLEGEIEKAKKEGYDGVVFKGIKDNYHPDTTISPSNNIVVFNPKSIKTKSQLKEIWNKAHNK